MKIALARDFKEPDTLDVIAGSLLAEDLPRCEALLARALQAQASYLTDAERALYGRGKKLRPMLLLLTARMTHGEGPLPERVIQGAVALEMLHVATLIHDDIVDESLTRRGLPSVHAARGVGTAVIIGDMQFVQALRGFVDAIQVDQDMALVRLVLDTAFDICRGELDEMQTPLDLSPVEARESYLRTIDRKTAALFGLACEAGVSLGGGRTHEARRAGFYGRRLGMAFQMMDDLFDLAMPAEASGKPVGVDLIMGRMSLPILYVLEEAEPASPFVRVMRGETGDPALLAAALAFARRSGAFQRAYSDARAEAMAALEYLLPFPDNRYRRALRDIVHYIVDRGF